MQLHDLVPVSPVPCAPGATTFLSYGRLPYGRLVVDGGIVLAEPLQNGLTPPLKDGGRLAAADRLSHLVSLLFETVVRRSQGEA
jgi:hypothetical protein